MKIVPLREHDGMNSIEVFRIVMTNAPNGVNVAQMRSRCRVLERLDDLVGAGGTPHATALVLEDADHTTLRDAIERYQFGGASKTLLRIIDDVIEAKAPD